MSMARVKNAGAFMQAATGTVAHTKSSGSINGPAIERAVQESDEWYGSGLLVGALADSVGAPSAVALDLHIEDSADGSTDWTDVTGLTHSNTTEDSISGSSVDLTGCRRYVRVVSTITHTGGSSPNSDYWSGLIMGGKTQIP